MRRRGFQNDTESPFYSVTSFEQLGGANGPRWCLGNESQVRGRYRSRLFSFCFADGATAIRYREDEAVSQLDIMLVEGPSQKCFSQGRLGQARKTSEVMHKLD
jgi:hypothetical protein